MNQANRRGVGTLAVLTIAFALVATATMRHHPARTEAIADGGQPREIVPVITAGPTPCAEGPSDAAKEADDVRTGETASLPAAPLLTPLTSRPSVERVPAYGPDRPWFSICRPASYVTFNSIVDEKTELDERGFLYGGADGASNYAASIEVELGVTYNVRAYVWNDVSPSVPDPYSLNAFSFMSFPRLVSEQSPAEATASICADNAIPECVWASMPISTRSKAPLALNTIGDYAAISYAEGDTIHEVPLSELFGAGTALGCEELNGKLDGTRSCLAYIDFSFEASEPDRSVSIAARHPDTGQPTMDPFDTMPVDLYHVNTGLSPQTQVEFEVDLPPNVGFVNDSSWMRLGDANNSWSEYQRVAPTISQGGSRSAWTAAVTSPLMPGETLLFRTWVSLDRASDLMCGGVWLKLQGSTESDGVTLSDEAVVDVTPIC